MGPFGLLSIPKPFLHQQESKPPYACLRQSGPPRQAREPQLWTRVEPFSIQVPFPKQHSQPRCLRPTERLQCRSSKFSRLSHGKTVLPSGRYLTVMRGLSARAWVPAPGWVHSGPPVVSTRVPPRTPRRQLSMAPYAAKQIQK